MCAISKVNLHLSLERSKSRTAHYHKVSPQQNINSTLIAAQIERCGFLYFDSFIIESSISIYLIYHAPIIPHLGLSCANDHIKHLAVSSDYFEIETVLFLSFYFRHDLSSPTIPDYNTGLSSFFIYRKFIK